MEKPKNPNHPPKGSRTTVDPIRSLDDIKAITRLLSDKPRDALLFTLGINSGLRTGDLLKLHVYDVARMKVGDTLPIKEGKTGKTNVLVVNKPIHKALRRYLDEVKPPLNSYLFASRKRKAPLTIMAVNSMIKSWTKAINLEGRYGAHSLRKTWGYQQRIVYGCGFEIIAKRFNHSNPAVTMRYIGIENKEVHSTLMNEIG